MTGARATASVVGGNEVTGDPERWTRLWALTSLAHILSNGLDAALQPHDAPNAALGFVALAGLARPASRRIRTAMFGLVVVSVLVEMPTVGNHWIVAGAVSALAIIARPWTQSGEWWSRFVPGARLILVVFYSFAAFAKLNSGFLNPIASCSRFFANQALHFWQLPEIYGDSPLAGPLAYSALCIELSVIPLLLWHRTRSLGVWLGVAFHLVLTLDLAQHFFDFTMVLVPLFLLFAPEGTLETLDARLPRPRRVRGRIWQLLGVMVVSATTLMVSQAAIVLGVLATWAAWLVLLVVFVRVVLLRRPGPTVEPLRLRPTSLPAALVVGLVLLNGLSPYLGLKTAFGFNMYSNLTTAGGETNHLLVPATAEFRRGQAETALILDSSDEDFAEYVDSGFAVPLINLRNYFAENPDVRVSFAVNGVRFDLERVGDHPEWVDRSPWYLERFAPFRALPMSDPPVCQASFLPAR